LDIEILLADKEKDDKQLSVQLSVIEQSEPGVVLMTLAKTTLFEAERSQ